MGNQNVKVFYKVQFDVEEKESDKDRDLLWDIVCHVRRWLERKGDVSSEIGTRAWSKFKTGGRIEEKNNDDFYAESYHRQNPENLDDISWACSINERQKELRYAPRWWTTEIGFKSKENGGARLTFVVSYSNEMGFIGQTLDEPEISVPNIVKNIQADNKLFCSILGKEPIRLKPQKLEVGKGVWFKEMLLSPERVSPIILIMPRRQKSGECIELSIDPELMAASVAGNATVYYSEDMSFVEEMGYLLDTDYRCEEGTVRLYLPHIDTSNSYDYIRHRFIHFHEVQELGKDIVLKIFRRVLAQDINDYDDLFRVSDCQALIQKDKYNKKISIIKQEHARQSAEHTDSIEDLRKQLENVKNDADREMEVVQFIHGGKRNAGVTERVIESIMALHPSDSLSVLKKRYEESDRLLRQVRENEAVQIRNTVKLNISYDEKELQKLLAQKVEKPILSEREQYLLSDEARKRTAREVICFIYLLNKRHVLAHLDGKRNVETNIQQWCEDIKSFSQSKE